MNCYTCWRKIKKISNYLKENEQHINQEFSPQEIQKLLNSIEEIAHDPTIDEASVKYILQHEKMQKPLERIRQFFLEVGEKREMDKAQEILDSSDPWLCMRSFHFYKRYRKLIENEHHLVNFDSNSKVIFIGGGPLPLTLIFLSLFYGVISTSIEIIPQVALLSRKVIDKLVLTSQIEVVVGETRLKDLDYFSDGGGPSRTQRTGF